MLTSANWSIRRRLVLIISSLTLLLTLGVASIALNANVYNLRTQAESRLIAYNQSVANALDTELYSVISTTRAFAAALAEETSSPTSQAWTMASKTLVNDDILLRRVNVYAPFRDTSQILVFNTPIEPARVAAMTQFIDYDIAPDSWFLTPLEDGLERWHGPDTAFDPSATQPVFSYAVPYTGSGNQWTGVVWGDVPASLLHDLIENSFRMDERYSYSMLVTDQNTLALSYMLPAENSAASNATVTDFLNTPRMTDVSSTVVPESGGLMVMDDPFTPAREVAVMVNVLPRTGWRLVSVVPSSVMQNPLDRTTFGVIVITLAGVIALGWIVYAFITRTVLNPLRVLGSAAQEIGSGDMRYHIEYQGWNNEIGRLAKALDGMKNNLAHSYRQLSMWSQTLEKRVAQRTEELEAAQKEAQETAAELRAVYEASLSVVSDYQLEPILQKLMQNMLALLETTYCAVWLLTADKKHLQLVATTADDKSHLNRRIGTNEGLVGAAILQSRLIVNEDYANWPNRLEGAIDPNVERAMAAPLMFYKRPIGAVLVGRKGDDEAFSDRDQRLLNLFANLVTPVVRNAQLFIQRDDARQEAERASSVKTRFLASVTHELRTPLNLIINNMDFMRIGQFGEVTAEQHERLNQTIRSAEHLLYLINDLLDVSKIEAGEMELTIMESDIQPVLEDALDSALMMIENKVPVITLTAHIPDNLPLIPMDARRVRQVLTNLLSNAVKFTQDGWIELIVRLVQPIPELTRLPMSEEGEATKPLTTTQNAALADAHSGGSTRPVVPAVEGYSKGNGSANNSGYLEISVRDTGIGIPEGEMNKLFEAFERTDRAKHMGIEGTGLGLPISRFLVEAHGGKMTVESKPGMGSTFTFTLPLGQSQTRREPTSVSELLAGPMMTPPPGSINRRDLPDEVKRLYEG